MKQTILPAQGQVNYLEALDISIEREIKAKYMYMTMAKYAKVDHMKKKLEFMAQEEQSHRDNLEDLYKKISGEAKNFDSRVQYPSSDKVQGMADMEMTQLLKIAVEKEIEANQYYVQLSHNSEDQGMADLFSYLAEEEANHRRMLEMEIRLYTHEKPLGLERSVEMVPGIYKEWW